MRKHLQTHWPLFALLTAALLAGLLTYRQYGLSWDEPSSYQYGREALSAYSRPATEPAYSDSNGLLQYYGAAWLITGAAITGDLTTLHLLNFLSFLLGAACLYFLLTRWVQPAAALAATALFLGQPLLWGHAFINPKDIPFLAFFLLSLVVGLQMVDEMEDSTGCKRTLLPVIAGLALGYATSTRIAAPLAGSILSLLALYRSRWKAIPFLVIYWLSSLAALYITWPYLWPDPFHRFFESLRVMASFPWQEKILFQGLFYKPNTLPRNYLPKLMLIQFTEPALALFGLGGLLMAWKTLQRQVNAEALILLGLWLALPAAALLLFQPTMYDNFRQYLFLTPPLFILGAFAFEHIFQRWNRPLAWSILVVLTLLPGLTSALRLHPYEYTYYNSLVGGTGGAFRKYETDYWATSFSASAAYINANAPHGATVAIGDWGLMQDLLRPDLQVNRTRSGDYIFLFTRWNDDQKKPVTGAPVYTVARDGAVFTIILKK